ncbi:MAG TPA: aspartyl protease family protein [Bacteroidales bacterium]|nr:aspartyl protease family protein [Bacteroidales bacterium]
MRLWASISIILLLITVHSGNAQNKSVARVPFNMLGSYIVVKAKINESSGLHFILDTGIRNTILTEWHTNDSLSLVINEERYVQGLGGGDLIFAYVSENNSIQLGKKLTFEKKTIVLLHEDVLELSRRIGSPINGLLGADLLEDYVVQIDFVAQRLIFYLKEDFKLPRKYKSLPLTIEQQKLYVPLKVKDNAKEYQLKMLLDTGAGLCAWLRTIGSDVVPIPEKKVYGRIGEGISGEVTGYLARIPTVCLGGFCLSNPVVVFPDSACISDLVIHTGRDGTVGNQLLSRFTLFIDVGGRQLHLHPNSHFKKKFSYNVAGLELIQSIRGLPRYEVAGVWPDSPAAQAGILPGDVIRQVEGDNAYAMSLSELRGYFEQSRKRTLRVVLERDGKLLTLNLDLKSKI